MQENNFRCGHLRTEENAIRAKSRGYYYLTCRICRNAVRRKWSQGHPEARRQQAQQYRNKNSEKIRLNAYWLKRRCGQCIDCKETIDIRGKRCNSCTRKLANALWIPELAAINAL